MTVPADYDPSRYPPFAVTVDIVVFTIEDGDLKVALIERGAEPYKGILALPGGFVRENEDLEAAAVRELAEETSLSPEHLEQLGAYGRPDRDPRMRIVTVGYWAIVPDLPDPVGGTDARAARKVSVTEALANPEALRFDHDLIITDALERARDALENTTIATDFCEPEFTMSELRWVYEAVWGTKLDQGNFQKKVLEIDGFVIPTGRRREGVRGRPPELFVAGPGQRIDPPFRRPRKDDEPSPT